jgi:hypothetical protein
MKLFMADNLICIQSSFEWTSTKFVINHKELTTVTEGLHYYAEWSLPDLLGEL